MAGFLGIIANAGNPIKAVQAGADELSSSGGALTGTVRELDGLVANMRWSGDDRVDFEKRWNSEVKPELERLAAAMLAHSDELTEIAAQQAIASDEQGGRR